MALDCRCHRSAEGEYALLRCVLLRTRCVWALARAWFGEGVWVGFGVLCVVARAVCFGFLPFARISGFVVSDGGPVLVFARAYALCLRAGIRDSLACFERCPCAGRHLLFFAAAKKSRQKKAAHTASPCSYPRAPNVPTLHTATPLFACVANALNRCLIRFTHPHKGGRQRMACAAQVANCV